MPHAEAEIRWRGDEIEDAGRRGEAARQKIGRLTYEINVQHYACAGLNVGTCYDRSPIIADDGSAHPAHTMDSYTHRQSRAAALRICGAKTVARSTMPWGRSSRC